MGYCTLGHIPKQLVKYDDNSNQCAIFFTELKTSAGRDVDKGWIYFDKSMVHSVNRSYVEIDMRQETYRLYVLNTDCREIIDISLADIMKSQNRYYKKHEYSFFVSQKAVKISNMCNVHKVLFDLPEQFWNEAESKNCLVDVFNYQFVVQNYNNRATITFGAKTLDITIKFTFELKDGSWKEKEMSAGRFWYEVEAAKRKKKEMRKW